MRKPTSLTSPTPRLKPLARALSRVFTGAWLLAGTAAWLPLQAAPALPSGLQVVAGQASASTQGAQMTVRNTPGAILNWQSFSIGSSNRVWFEQAGAASKVLNRVVGNDPSLILGQLGSNGQVWLLNPHGVLFGAGARVDVAGLVAGTLRLNDNDFIGGRMRFTALDGDAGRVRNEGQLSTTFGGQVVLLAPQVENAGSVSAPGGNVTLAAARSVDLVDTGLPNLAVRVNTPAGEALNLGRLLADGGKVDVHGAIVNQQGWVQADTLRTDATGQVVLRAADTLTLGERSVTRALGSAAGSSGGQVDLLGQQVAVTGQALVDVSGAAGGGGIRLGGGLQGRDASVPNARAVYLGPQATLRADASGEAGQGGRIVLWADAATRAYGSLSARGGTQAGDGGFIETSGGWLDARPARVDLSARAGRAGSWLLDPNDITINNAGPDTNITGGPNFSSSNDASVLSTATIAAALNAGTSVTVSTGSGGSNAQAGDITVDGATLAVNPGSAVSLSLNAARDILVRNSSIGSSGQALSLNLVSASNGTAGAIEISNSSISTAGGSVTLRGAQQRQGVLPGPGLTPDLLPLALGYNPAQQALPSKLAEPTIGVNLRGSSFNLGSGSFSAYGQGGPGGGTTDGVAVKGLTAAGGSVINARDIALNGFGGAGSSIGVVVKDGSTDLTASQSLALRGAANLMGTALMLGGRATLNAPGNPAATLSFDGLGSSYGVYIEDTSFRAGVLRGTPLTVTGGSATITGQALGSFMGVLVDAGGSLGSPVPAAPTLDLTSAAGLDIIGSSLSGDALRLTRVRIAAPAAGTSTLNSAGGRVFLEQVDLSAGGVLAFNAPWTEISVSNLAAAGAPLNISFTSTGASTRGVHLSNSSFSTAGGDIRFGADRLVCSAVLGCTTTVAPWIFANASDPAYSGPSIQAALWIEGSTLDAGAGRIDGGGAASETASNFTAGATLEYSVFKGSEIALKGRSETESGINVAFTTMAANRVLNLDGLTSALFGASGFVALSISTGSELRLNDPGANAGSAMTLRGSTATVGSGVGISGGDAGSDAETTLVVSGGALVIDGTTSGPGTTVSLTGTTAAPGGLLIDTLGATGVTINAVNAGSAGQSLFMRNMNLLGPQASAASTMDISARGGRTTGGASSTLNNISLSSAGSVRFVTDGLAVINSRLSGDAGLQLLTDTFASGRAEAPISITTSILAADGPGAALRIQGSGGDAVRGNSALNAGTGLLLTDSSLQAAGSGGQIVLKGVGAPGGGTGLSFLHTPMTAAQISLSGTGQVNAHGVVSEDTGSGALSRLSATDLSIQGSSANDPLAPNKAGVLLGNGVVLALAGRGNLNIGGDTVVLGSASGSAPLLAQGDAASFDVRSSDSMRLRNATLDFSAGSGTLVQLRADADDNAGGRARLDNLLVNTGGGDFIASGVGVRRGSPNPQPINTLVADGASGLLITGITIDAGAGTVSLLGRAIQDGNPPVAGLGNSGLLTAGANTVTARTVSLQGDGGDLGVGINIGGSLTGVPSGSTLGLTADTITAVGSGRGNAPDTGAAYEGLMVGPGNVWTARNGGTLSLNSVTGPAWLSGVNFSARDMTLATQGALSLSGVALLADESLRVQIHSATAVALGNGLALDGTALGAAVALMPASAGLTLQVTGGGALNVQGPLAVPAHLQLRADGVALQPGATVSSNAAGDAIVIGGASTPFANSFANSAGAGSLSTPNGRWLLLPADPRQTALGGLAPDFTAYNLAAQPWAADGAGNLLTPATGHGVGYGVAVADLSGQALGGRLAKVYDAGTAIALNPLAWTLSGLLPGDQLSYSGTATATLPDKNVGSARPASLDAGTAFSVTDANGRPVFGYGRPSFTADVTPRTLTLTGAAVANKVYDGGTAASMASLGGVAALAGDSVQVGGSVLANYADRNVGSAKPVSVSGIVLTGPDAGNYSLQLPGAYSADITPLALQVSGLGALSRVYDGSRTAQLSGSAAISALAGDSVLLSGSAAGTFADKNAGTAKPVTVAGLSLAGADAANYTLQLTGLAADITPAPLALTGLGAAGRVYDGSRSAPLTGSAAIAPLAGDSVTLAGSAAGSFADKNVGSNKAVTVAGLGLAGADAANYALQPPTGLRADVTPAPLSLQGLAAAGKVYDGNTMAALSASLAGAVAGDGVTLNLSGTFSDSQVGSGKTVRYDAALAGPDAGNYTLAGTSGSLQGSIAPATLRYVASPAFGTVGQALPLLDGSISGFVAGETLASATTGTAIWSTNATVGSPLGSYAITGSGLAAANYAFVQAPGNAGALTLRAASTSDAATTTTTVATVSALAAVQIPVAMSTPTQGRVLDVTLALSPNMGATAAPSAAAPTALAATATAPTAAATAAAASPSGPGTTAAAAAAAAPTGSTGGADAPLVLPGAAQVAASLAALSAGEAADGVSFRSLDWSRLPRDEVQTLLAARARYKQKVFANSIHRLQQDPKLADVQACRSEAELSSGSCVITAQLKAEIQAARAAAAAAQAPRLRNEGARRVRVAALPTIERKMALLIGVNVYSDKRVPELVGAVPDARAVRTLLEDRLGYEATVLENPGREAIVRAFNKLALEAQPNDSVIVYYAGHGVVVPVDGLETGFWLPADVDAESPATWLANADIARMIAAVGSRQLMLVSDSCYSGALAGRDRVQLSASDNAEDLLTRRAAVIMSSGGDEPVADEGREGHSIFAWHFMRALESLDRWQVGGSLYERVRNAVQKDFPQTPQYGAARTAGHQGNTDYLFERREFEVSKP